MSEAGGWQLCFVGDDVAGEQMQQLPGSGTALGLAEQTLGAGAGWPAVSTAQWNEGRKDCFLG